MPQVSSSKQGYLSTRTKLLIGGAVFVLALASGYYLNQYLINQDAKAVKSALANNQALMLTKSYATDQAQLQAALPRARTAPERLAVLQDLSASYLISGNCTAAIKYYSQLETAGVKTAETAKQQAYCNVQLGNITQARSLYKLALARVATSNSPVKTSDEADIQAAIDELGVKQ
jgi:hypothetical protein